MKLTQLPRLATLSFSLLLFLSACGHSPDKDGTAGDGNPDNGPGTLTNGRYRISNATLVSDTCDSGLDPTIYNGLTSSVADGELLGEIMVGGIVLVWQDDALVGLLQDGTDWNESGYDCIILVDTTYTGTVPRNNELHLKAEEHTWDYEGSQCMELPITYPQLPCDVVTSMTYTLDPDA